MGNNGTFQQGFDKRVLPSDDKITARSASGTPGIPPPLKNARNSSCTLKTSPTVFALKQDICLQPQYAGVYSVVWRVWVTIGAAKVYPCKSTKLCEYYRISQRYHQKMGQLPLGQIARWHLGRDR